MKIKEQIDEAIRLDRLRLPRTPKVVSVRCNLMVDSIGDDAIDVWVLVDDSTPDEGLSWDRVQPIHEEIHRALREAEVELWPYIKFRRQAEAPDI